MLSMRSQRGRWERVRRGESKYLSYFFLKLIIVQYNNLLMLKTKLVVNQGQKVMGLYNKDCQTVHLKKYLF